MKAALTSLADSIGEPERDRVMREGGALDVDAAIALALGQFEGGGA